MGSFSVFDKKKDPQSVDNGLDWFVLCFSLFLESIFLNKWVKATSAKFSLEAIGMYIVGEWRH